MVLPTLPTNGNVTKDGTKNTGSHLANNVAPGDSRLYNLFLVGVTCEVVAAAAAASVVTNIVNNRTQHPPREEGKGIDRDWNTRRKNISMPINIDADAIDFWLVDNNESSIKTARFFFSFSSLLLLLFCNVGSINTDDTVRDGSTTTTNTSSSFTSSFLSSLDSLFDKRDIDIDMDDVDGAVEAEVEDTSSDDDVDVNNRRPWWWKGRWNDTLALQEAHEADDGVNDDDDDDNNDDGGSTKADVVVVVVLVSSFANRKHSTRLAAVMTSTGMDVVDRDRSRNRIGSLILLIW
jgi:hypothetical protein